MPYQAAGKILIVIGGLIVVVGLMMVFGDKIPFFGKLPGDITIRRENMTIHFPIVTMVIISLLLTMILNLFGRK